ncbi:hypothetical protein CCH79_00011142 [Gambusia affinis]|uniref:Claudin n=1 Tax=Gambusia affinis TaxID=33528 RepID=A0A315URC4_GAMAF|nr:hypothetical protein CCH79_00011142 [Gambusia affinis]
MLLIAEGKPTALLWLRLSSAQRLWKYWNYRVVKPHAGAGMIYLAHTAHRQFLGLVFGFLAWLFIVTTTGINEWRLWYVDDVSVITSGVAWVGIWRACFYSHVLPEAEYCRSIGVSDIFAPAEIPSAQVLMMLAVVTGLLGNVSAAVAVRFAYFSVEDRRNMRLSFALAGALYSVTASVGAAIGMGMFASILMLVSGVIFFCYRHSSQTADPLDGRWTVQTLPKRSELPIGDGQAMDNPGFHSEERFALSSRPAFWARDDRSVSSQLRPVEGGRGVGFCRRPCEDGYQRVRLTGGLAHVTCVGREQACKYAEGPALLGVIVARQGMLSLSLSVTHAHTRTHAHAHTLLQRLAAPLWRRQRLPLRESQQNHRLRVRSRASPVSGAPRETCSCDNIIISY